MDGGDRYRELVSWAVMVVHRQRERGVVDSDEEKLINESIFRFTNCLTGLYDIKNQPVPFVYIHLVRVLTVVYLPVFAFIGGATCDAKAVHVVMNLLAILISNLFFVGIQSIASKFSDPFGNKIYDLRVVTMISRMPVACEAVLATELPAPELKLVRGTRAKARLATSR